MVKKKLNKLLAMSGDEIFYRLKEKLFESMECCAHKFAINRLTEEKWARAICGVEAGQEVDDQLFNQFWHGRRDRFFTEAYDNSKRVPLIKKHFECENWISEAEGIMEGKLTLLGRRIEISSQRGWHLDPLNGTPWPRLFYSRVTRSRDVSPCDIKYIWEINRHQYLIVLGKAYWVTGNEKYAEKVCAVIEDWVSENPYNSGVNWTSSLELAVRAISWIWAYFLCEGSRHLTPPVHKIFMKSIYEHAIHIEKHLSYYSSPYNHLIGEAAALHVIGSLFPRFREGRRWENLGWSILVEQVDEQFHPDGMSVEQASFYHHFTLGFYLQSILLRKLNKKQVPEKVLSRVERALEFSMYVTKPDGTVPMIGDIDNARSLYFGLQHSWDFRGFLGIGAILFKRSDFKSRCNGVPEEVSWLCNEEQLEEFFEMESEIPSQTSKAFFDSGYFISKDSWKHDSHYLCFDCGDIADGLYKEEIPSAAHGHADALSFELSAYGKSFIVDGGFHTYFGDLAWHKYYRLEEAHNTLKIGHYRQAEYSGRLTWQCVTHPELKKWISNQDYDFVAGHINYNGDVRHGRQIVYLKKQFWFLNDSVLTNDPSMEVDSYLHFDPAVDLIVDQDGRKIIAYIDNVGILIKYFNNAKVTYAKGGKEPSEGWVAPGYGIKRSAWRVQFEWNANKHNGFYPMLIVPWRERYDFIQFGKAKWSSDADWFFETEFSINRKTSIVRIVKSGNIQVCNDKSIFNT